MSNLNRNQWSVLGLPFDVVDQQTAISRLIDNIDSKSNYFVSTPNLNFLIAAQSDTDFFNSVVDSDLSVADGMPLIWIAKILRIPLPERIAGSTLFDELSKKTRTEKIKVFFFGGQEGVAENAHQKLNQTSSAMMSCGYYDPGFVSVDEMSSKDVISIINSAEPDFIVVALGAKKGQQWIQKNKKELKPCVISHLGAVINFVAGNIDRAPVLWQKYGFEWLWRIKQEPNLWKRYLSDGLAFSKLVLFNVLPLAIYDRYLTKAKAFDNQINVNSVSDDSIEIELSGSMDSTQLSELRLCFENMLNSGYIGKVITINFRNVSYIDGAFIAILLTFQRSLESQNNTLLLGNMTFRISLLLKLNNVWNRFKAR